MPITGTAPTTSSAAYTLLGPKRSQSQPTPSRASTVAATDAIRMLPICSLVSPSSFRMIGMSGATPNQPKKHQKNETHVTWNARMAGVLKLKRSMRLAFMSLRCGRRHPWTRIGDGNEFFDFLWAR